MNSRQQFLVSMTILLASLSGCSHTPAVVQTGDRVEVGFTCRLPSGELAATTRPDSSMEGEKKSPYYLPRNGADTVAVTAGGRADAAVKDRVPFEDEIIKRIEISLAGLKEGDRVVRELQAERYPSASPTDRFVRMATVRKRQKEMRLSREEYSTKSGKEPEVGQRFILDPLVPGRVAEVTTTEVLVRFAPEPGKPLVTPFGPVTLRETETHYELLLSVENNRLIRTGGMAGRIVDVTEDSFKVDYGHPFGGERLICDVTVDEVKSGVQKAAAPVAAAQPAAKAEQSSQPTDASAGTLDPAAEKVFSQGLANMLAMKGLAPSASEPVRQGDLVTANYTVTLEDGSLVATSREAAARDQGVKKVSWYRPPAQFETVELVAGKQEVMPGLAEALVGMRSGERRSIVLTPDKAFGPSDPGKFQKLPRSQTFAKVVRVPAEEYVKRFSGFPVIGKEVSLMPYFTSRVTEVSEKDVALEFQVADGAVFNDSFGSLAVAVSGGSITSNLSPQLGAAFPLKDGFGVISAFDTDSFTIDLNHPLAGKTLTIDLEAVAVTPAPATGVEISWIDNHDTGLERGRQDGKPVFMILHADWCSWCKKTFSETLPDPRIAALRDRFVWVRVNSDKEQKYKQLYGQEGFPMMVLLNPDGSIARKIDGYRDARALRDELKAVLH